MKDNIEIKENAEKHVLVTDSVHAKLSALCGERRWTFSRLIEEMIRIFELDEWQKTVGIKKEE